MGVQTRFMGTRLFLAVLLSLAFLPFQAFAAQAASDSAGEPFQLNTSGLSSLFQNGTSVQLDAAVRSLSAFGAQQNITRISGTQVIGILALLGVQQNASVEGLPSQAAVQNATGGAGVSSAGQQAQPQQGLMPQFAAILSQFRALLFLLAILMYVFAAGRIAEFTKLSGARIGRREALAIPAAYLIAGLATIAAYYASGHWVPPQNTPITLAFYIVAIPIAIFWLMGAAALYMFFREKAGIVGSLDLSMKIALAPLFDGLKGYWTALGAAAVLSLVSAVSFYSSGGNMALLTLDFTILSCVSALYFAYRALTAKGSEPQASNMVTALCIVSPIIMQKFFRDFVCAALALLPIRLFAECPLLSMDGGATLGVSIAATVVLLVPIVPFIYAGVVNALRAGMLLGIIAEGEGRKKPDKEE